MDRVAHSQQVRATLGSFYAAISDAESSQRNYLLTGNPEYFEDYHQQSDRAHLEIKALAALVADDPSQTQTTRLIESALNERLARLETVVHTFQESGLSAAMDAIVSGEGLQITDRLRTLTGQMDSTEAELLRDRRVTSSRAAVKTLVSMGATLVAAMAMAGSLSHEHGQRNPHPRPVPLPALANFKAALDEHAIVSIANVNGQITYVNDRFCAISKYSREESSDGTIASSIPDTIPRNSSTNSGKPSKPETSGEAK